VQTNNARDLICISLAFFFAFLGAGACQPFVIGFLTAEKGLTLAQASLVLAMVYFTFAVFRFFIGVIIDAVGLHLAKILGVAAYAVFPFILCQAGSFPVFLAASVIWGIGAPMLWTSSLVQILNTSAPTRYATHTGVLRGTVMLAVFAGAYLLAFVYACRGYEALFGLAAALCLGGIVAMVCSPNRRFKRRKPHLRMFFQVMRSHEAKTVTVFLVCSGLAYGIVLNGFKSHIETHCGKDWLKIILPVFFLAGILSNFLGGWVCDRVGRWKTFGWGFAIGATGMFLAWGSTSAPVLMVAMLLIGIEFAIVPLSAFAWIGDNTPPPDRGSVIGYIFSFRDLGVALAIQLRSTITEVATAALVFAIASAVCAGAALVAGRAAPRRKRQSLRQGSCPTKGSD